MVLIGSATAGVRQCSRVAHGMNDRFVTFWTVGGFLDAYQRKCCAIRKVSGKLWMRCSKRDLGHSWAIL
jgi:hypothetical protein